MREVIFEGLKWYIPPVGATVNPDRKRKGRRRGET
jgi:hypothetical protein